MLSGDNERMKRVEYRIFPRRSFSQEEHFNLGHRDVSVHDRVTGKEFKIQT